jgi:hypothetical protein
VSENIMSNLEIELDLANQERKLAIRKFKKYWRENKFIDKYFLDMSNYEIAGYYLFRYSKVNESIMIKAIENNLDNIGGAIWILLDCKVDIPNDIITYAKNLSNIMYEMIQ